MRREVMGLQMRFGGIEPKAAQLIICAVVVAVAAVAFGPDSEAQRTASESVNRAAMDVSVNACDDFYRHACGGFIATARPSQTRPMVTLNQEQADAALDLNLQRLFTEDASKDGELRRLKTFHSSCLRSANGEDQASVGLVKRWLVRIDSAKSGKSMQTLIRDLSKIRVEPFFRYGAWPDRTDMTRYRGEIEYSSISSNAQIIERTFVLTEMEPSVAKREAAAVAEIAAVLRPDRGDRWDGKTAENPHTLAQLRQIAPAIDWAAYFSLVGAKPAQRVNVVSPKYLAAVDRVIATRPVQDLRAFMRWSFLFSLRGELPPPYNQGFGELPPNARVAIGDRAQMCRDAMVRAMGIEFSRQYASRILGLDTRNAARQMAETIQKDIVRSVESRSWLSEDSRRKTADKLARTALDIGFPDEWPPVGTYALSPDDFLANVINARSYQQQQKWARAKQGRSLAKWEMIVYPWVGEGMASAQLTLSNAFPDALSNSIIVNAGFLTPQRFSVEAPLEANYATFGATFAHEFVHVAQSYMFGADGADIDLWSPEDIAGVERQRMCVVDQADAFEVLPGLKGNGKTQVWENEADFGGLRLAYEALAARLGPSIDRPDANGMTPGKRFFYSFAQSRCVAQTEDSLRQFAVVDGHASAAFRVNAPISNLPAFSRTFGCAAGAKMARPSGQICEVW